MVIVVRLLAGNTHTHTHIRIYIRFLTYPVVACVVPPSLSAKLMEEKCDFQRSMANNEAKLKQNEDDLRRAQREFVETLEKANLAYSRNRWVLAS